MWVLMVETLIYDILSGRQDTERETRMFAMFERAAREYSTERVANRANALARVEQSDWALDRADLARYAGRYHNPALGDLLVTEEGGRLQFSAGAYSAELLPVEPGTFLALDDGIDVELVHIEDSGFRWGDDQFERVTAP
jgi:hypothetical protein